MIYEMQEQELQEACRKWLANKLKGELCSLDKIRVKVEDDKTKTASETTFSAVKGVEGS